MPVELAGDTSEEHRIAHYQLHRPLERNKWSDQPSAEGNMRCGNIVPALWQACTCRYMSCKVVESEEIEKQETHIWLTRRWPCNRISDFLTRFWHLASHEDVVDRRGIGSCVTVWLDGSCTPPSTPCSALVSLPSSPRLPQPCRLGGTIGRPAYLMHCF